jgi:hypothetical protein
VPYEIWWRTVWKKFTDVSEQRVSLRCGWKVQLCSREMEIVHSSEKLWWNCYAAGCITSQKTVHSPLAPSYMRASESLWKETERFSALNFQYRGDFLRLSSRHVVFTCSLLHCLLDLRNNYLLSVILQQLNRVLSIIILNLMYRLKTSTYFYQYRI